MYNITFRYYYNYRRYHKFTKKFNTLSEVAEFKLRSSELYFDAICVFSSHELEILASKLQFLIRSDPIKKRNEKFLQTQISVVRKYLKSKKIDRRRKYENSC